jgi:hypothetical protein
MTGFRVAVSDYWFSSSQLSWTQVRTAASWTLNKPLSTSEPIKGNISDFSLGAKTKAAKTQQLQG